MGLHRDGVYAVLGVGELRGHGTLPDEDVELLLVLAFAGIAVIEVCWPDGFVGLLGALFGLPCPGLGRNGQFVRLGEGADFGDGFG